ncbi:hypothetical protein PR048_002870 [Dryococelus australis]|uniref:Uncharacterized protein n=1 Tax=Dryococelus australis TaxID=614101 RepID=A0ABQ9ILE1_9NEOP|nr:hypothetical protein PR048_002870 [Dryococelus australis]
MPQQQIADHRARLLLLCQSGQASDMLDVVDLGLDLLLPSPWLKTLVVPSLNPAELPTLSTMPFAKLRFHEEARTVCSVLTRHEFWRAAIGIVQPCAEHNASNSTSHEQRADDLVASSSLDTVPFQPGQLSDSHSGEHGFESRSDHSDFCFPWLPEVTPGEYWDCTSLRAMADSLPVPLRLSYMRSRYRRIKRDAAWRVRRLVRHFCSDYKESDCVLSSGHAKAAIQYGPVLDDPKRKNWLIAMHAFGAEDLLLHHSVTSDNYTTTMYLYQRLSRCMDAVELAEILQATTSDSIRRTAETRGLLQPDARLLPASGICGRGAIDGSLELQALRGHQVTVDGVKLRDSLRTGHDSRRVPVPDLRTWESCRTTPLVGGYSRVSPAPPTLAFRSQHSPLFAPVGSRDLAVKGRPNLSTKPPCLMPFSTYTALSSIFDIVHHQRSALLTQSSLRQGVAEGRMPTTQGFRFPFPLLGDHEFDPGYLAHYVQILISLTKQATQRTQKREKDRLWHVNRNIAAFGRSNFRKPLKIETTMAGRGFEPKSYRMRVQSLTTAPPRSTFLCLERVSCKGYTGTRYKSAIAPTRRSLNWRAVFS